MKEVFRIPEKALDVMPRVDEHHGDVDNDARGGGEAGAKEALQQVSGVGCRV